MIKSFRHRGLKRLYEQGDRSGIRPNLVDIVERILTAFDIATEPKELDIPRYHLHPWVLVRYSSRELANYFSV